MIKVRVRACNNYAPDTLAVDYRDRDICTTCFYRGIDHDLGKKYRASFYRAPAHARLMRALNIDRACSIKIRRIIHGTLDPATLPKTQAWIRQCYHRPCDLDLRMSAINELLDMHGVESIESSKQWLAGQLRAEYCNSGDTYAPTILYDYTRDQFCLTSFGDFIERNAID